MNYLVHHLLQASARRLPDKECLVFRDQRLTYRQVDHDAKHLASALTELGVARGDRVGVYLEPSIEQVVSIFAASYANAAFVPIHHSLFPLQIAHIVNDCSMTILITDAGRLAQLDDVLPELTSLKKIIVVGEAGQSESNSTIAYQDIFNDHHRPVPKTSVIEKDLAAILYTSGSTGKPKGVMLSHQNVVAGASIVSEYLSITEQERILAVLPFSFDAGLNQLTTAFQQGGTLVVMQFLFARDIVQMLARESITGLAGVPSLWALLAQPNSKLQSAALPKLRYFTNTGGAMQAHVLSALREAQPDVDVVLMYGLTEAFRSTYLPPDQLDTHSTSIGKAIPNTEILVVNDDGEKCRPGEIGELVHHGPTVSLGYWGHPDLTDQVLRPHPFPTPGLSEECKVCYSGDLVQMDEDGYLFFVGRKDHQIKCSGFRVSPNEVEEILCKLAPLREAAVIGQPDEVLGQRIVAFVVPAEDKSIDVDQLLADCATSMPRHMLPKSIEVVAELPKTSSGKVDYRSLRQFDSSVEAEIE